MKTWKEHSYKLKAVDFPWASGQAWASQTIKRGDKYYWYVTAEHKSIHGKGIGVAVADSPTGPFIPVEKPLVTNNMTTKYTGISWDDIDPTAIVDDDGQAYLIWGNTQLYYAKLKDNMVELDGDVMTMEIRGIRMPSNPKEWNEEAEADKAAAGSNFFTEAPWIQAQGLVLPDILYRIPREDSIRHEPFHQRTMGVQGHTQRSGRQQQHKPSCHRQLQGRLVFHLPQRQHQHRRFELSTL